MPAFSRVASTDEQGVRTATAKQLVCRAVVPNDHYQTMHDFVEATAPDVLYHLAVASQPTQPRQDTAESWRVNYTWSSELARPSSPVAIPRLLLSK